jgi:acetyl esterase
MPPTIVITAECDVLRDEGEAYAQRLSAAGVAVTARRVEGLPHGFIRLHNLVDAADDAITAIAADIAQLCFTPCSEQPLGQALSPASSTTKTTL